MKIFVTFKIRKMISRLSAEELLLFNCHKKVAVTATVAGDQEYQKANLNFQKEFLDNYIDTNFKNLSLEHEKQMEKYNAEIQSVITNVVQDLESKSLTFVTDSQISLNDMIDQIESQIKKTETSVKSQITSFKNDISLISTEVTANMAIFANGILEDIKQKCFDIKVKNVQEMKEIDLKLDKKILEYSETSGGVDGIKQYRQYEAMVADLKSKFYTQPLDQKQKAIVADLHAKVDKMKDELTQLHNKLVNSLTIVSSNIIGFKRRAFYVIQDYKSHIEDSIENEKQTTIDFSNFEKDSNRELEELKLAQTVEDDEYQTQYNDLQTEIKDEKLLYDGAVADITRLDQTDAEVEAYINNLKESSLDEERATRDAFEKLQTAINERTQQLTDKIATSNEKFTEIMENFNNQLNSNKEKHSSDQDNQDFHNQTEISDENRIYSENYERIRPLLEDFRERYAKYQKLSKEKTELTEQLAYLKDYIKNLPVEEIDMKPYQDAYAKNIQQNNAEEKDLINSNEAQINAILADYQLQLTKFSSQMSRDQESAISQMQDKYSSMGKYVADDLELEYEKLSNELEAIIIGDTRELEARKKLLQELRNQKKELVSTNTNEKAALLRGYRNTMITEDDRHQKALLNNLGMDINDDQQMIDLKRSFEQRIAPLKSQEQKLIQELNQLNPKKGAITVNLEDLDTDGQISALSEKLKKTRLECEEKISNKNTEVKESLEKAAAENEEAKKQIEIDNQNEIKRLKENEEKREHSIELLKENLSKSGGVTRQRLEMQNKEFELSESMMKQKFADSKQSLNDKIGQMKTDLYNQRMEFEKKYAADHISQEESAFEFSNKLENMAVDIRSKRDEFVKRYDDEIKTRKDNLEIIKEKYNTRPPGPKEKESLDILSEKKQYLEKLSNLEKKTYKKYVVLGSAQETEFNERFGNMLNVGRVVQPAVKKRYSLELKRAPMAAPR